MLDFLLYFALIVFIFIVATLIRRYQKHKPLYFSEAFSKDYFKSRSLVSHRGYGKRGPIAENTYKAIHEAVLQGFTFHEFDVRVSKDDAVILFHGRDLSTTTDGQGRLESKTLVELEKLNWGDYLKAEKYDLTLLQDILRTFANKNILNIEIKRDWFDFRNKEIHIINQIKKNKVEDSVFLSSFNLIALINLRSLAPNLKIGALLEPGFAFCLRLFIFEFLARPHFLHLPANEITLKRMKRFKKKGYGVLVYTVNKQDQVDRLLAQGVELIVTDNISEFGLV